DYQWPALSLSTNPRIVALGQGRSVDVGSWDQISAHFEPYLHLEGVRAPWTFSPDGKILATTVFEAADHNIWIIDAETGKVVKVLRGHQSTSARYLAFCPDGKTLASSNRDSVILWDLLTGQEILSFSEADHEYAMFGFSRNRMQLAVYAATRKGTI